MSTQNITICYVLQFCYVLRRYSRVLQNTQISEIKKQQNDFHHNYTEFGNMFLMSKSYGLLLKKTFTGLTSSNTGKMCSRKFNKYQLFNIPHTGKEIIWTGINTNCIICILELYRKSFNMVAWLEKFNLVTLCVYVHLVYKVTHLKTPHSICCGKGAG